jgi:general nucleoside transport system permease protein
VSIPDLVGRAAATVQPPTIARRTRLRVAIEEAVLPPIVALLIAALVGDVLIITYGQSPGAVYRLLIQGTWGNPYGLGQVLYKTTTLTFTGLAVAIGLRAGLFNIGAESQLAAGGFLAAVVGTWLPAGMPALLALPVLVLAAAAGGGVVGGAAGVLKARWNAHEVITTIMLNFIVLALLNYLVVAHFKVFDTLHTADIRAGALPRLSDLAAIFHGSAANVVLFLALAAVVGAWWYLFRSRAGYDLRATGLQPQAAEYAGINVPGVWWRTMLVSGAVAGAGGINFVLGYKHYYEDGFATGAGFLGIAVALVGRNNPVGVLVAALLFATLSQGGLAVNALVPKQMVEVLQAVVIIAVATSVPEVRALLRSTRRDPPA